MTSNYSDKLNAWSRYWEKGFLTTFAVEAGENYTGEIKKYWFDQFQSLPDGAVMIDCGAGNGAILALATEFMRYKNIKFNLYAVDIADISRSTEFYRDHPEIQLVGKTSLENIPIASDTADLCVSQFGFEYSDVSLSSAELLRVLKPSGIFSCLIHNSSSEISLASRASLEHIDLCENTNLSGIVMDILDRLEVLRQSEIAPRNDPIAGDLRQRYNEIAGRLLDYCKSVPEAPHVRYYLNELSGVFGSKGRGLSYEQKRDIILSVHTESQLYKIRMTSMVDASYDKAEMSKLDQQFKVVGFKVSEYNEFNVDNAPLAWEFKAVK